MDRPLRLKINELIENKQITENLGIICLACLHEKIKYAKRNYGHLEPQRNTIAKFLVDNGVDKAKIAYELERIDKDCYPTLNSQVKNTYNNIILGSCRFVDEIIPAHYIKHKSEEKLKLDMSRTPYQESIEQEMIEFQMLKDYVEALIGYELSKPMINKLKGMKNKEYTYSLILDTFKVYAREIDRAINKNDLDYNGKFNYMLGVVNRKLPEYYSRIKEREKRDIEQWAYNAFLVLEQGYTVDDIIMSNCNSEGNFLTENEAKNKLLKAIEALKKDEHLMAKARREYKEVIEIANHKPAVYVRKTKENKWLEEKYKDLW